MAKRKNGTNGNGGAGHNRKGTIRMYRKIVEHDHDPDMDEVCSVIAKEGLTETQAAMLSGVGRATIGNWKARKTKRPQHLTMLATLRGIGYAFKIQQVEKMDYTAELPKAERWHERRETLRNQRK